MGVQPRLRRPPRPPKSLWSQQTGWVAQLLPPAAPMTVMGEQVTPMGMTASRTMPRRPRRPLDWGESEGWMSWQHNWGPVWHCCPCSVVPFAPFGAATARRAKAVVATRASLENIFEGFRCRKGSVVVNWGSKFD